MDTKNRELLVALLESLDAAAAKIDEAMKPFRDADSAVAEARDAILEHFEADVFGSCESCTATILVGDKYQPTADAGPLCEDCAATWGDIKKQAEEMGDDFYEEPGDPGLAIAAVVAHVAAGGSLSDKPLSVA